MNWYTILNCWRLELQFALLYLLICMFGSCILAGLGLLDRNGNMELLNCNLAVA
ncbi:hypothetical protein RchiOBHm_Chr1g0332201 [Rosa chinensis]|uniref:Uncharacterized protein n=1 Tax=Rosa chinensis TaxID=74649 RepID=A0A2P6SBQ3_ROSCH|nr:hypothetical protein RchiOBHm_Chr1g0332201 [Rosa chinensis]